MIKNTSPSSSSTPTLPKGCIYRVNGYLNHKVKYHIVNRRNEVMAWGFKTYADAVAKASFWISLLAFSAAVSP